MANVTHICSQTLIPDKTSKMLALLYIIRIIINIYYTLTDQNTDLARVRTSWGKFAHPGPFTL